ncbi:MAG: PKD domain protein [Candidatus Syntrophoarchaeum sp. GoM_oil]|nr:MAG: PKD domain protein [Candidatus Syntrophoarchaeum sp. GoM_oil]
MMFDTELASDSASFIVGSGDYEGADLSIDYEDYYDPNDVKFNATVNNTGNIILNPVLQFEEEEIALGELQAGQSITEELELPLKDPGTYRYLLKVANKGTVLDVEKASFVVRAEDVLFASINTDKAFYNLGDEVSITTKVENITFHEVNVPVNLSVKIPSGDLIETEQFVPEENGTYIVKALPVAEGCVVHGDELFFVVEKQSDLVLEVHGNLTYDETSNITLKVKAVEGGSVEGARVTIGNITKLTDTNGETEFVLDPKGDDVSVKAEKTGFNPDLKTIEVNEPFVASFTFTPQNPVVGEEITFNATYSKGNITSYTWNFSDGNITTVVDPVITHAYSLSGVYTVNLTVTDNEGLINSTTKNVTVGCGDLNSDGTINMTDVYLLLNHVGNHDDYQTERDVNCNGSVNIGDVILLLNHVGDRETYEF